MDTISLFYFVEAAKDLNFTQTANRLYLSQQTLSNHIARLETICGSKLFDRKPRLQLTYVGTIFLAYAKQTLMNESNIMASIASVSNEDAGRILVGTTTTRAAFFIPKILPDFNRKYPKFCIEVVDFPSYLLQEKLLSNSVDCCIGILNFESSEIQRTHLMTDRVYLCLSEILLRKYWKDCDKLTIKRATGGITVDRFPNLPVVFPASNIALAQSLHTCYLEANTTPNIILSSTYPQMYDQLFYNGHAAAFITELNLISLLENKPASAPPMYAFPILQDGSFLDRELVLATKRNQYLSPPVQHFISRVQALFTSIEMEYKSSEPVQ